MFTCACFTYYRDIITNNAASTKNQIWFSRASWLSLSKDPTSTFFKDIHPPQKKRTQFKNPKQRPASRWIKLNQVAPGKPKRYKFGVVIGWRMRLFEAQKSTTSVPGEVLEKMCFFFQKIEGYAAIFWIPKNEVNIYAVHFWFVKIWGSGLVDCLWFVYFEEKKHHSEGFILWDGWNTNKNHRTRLNGNLWKSYEISTWLRQLQSFIGLGSNSSILVVFWGHVNSWPSLKGWCCVPISTWHHILVASWASR